ncbi:MAG: hypothetical protein IT243_04135 [Bacteroidia bacterium]|nr:hypothetical protein [Bacteroidia bacterium]
MLNKLRFCLISAFTILYLNAFSQQNTRSPYSLYGVGILHYDGFADNVSIGRNGSSYRFQSNYSLKNPSSLSALKVTVFNASAFVDIGKFKTNTINSDFSNAGFNYISLAAPVKKLKSGVGFALLPFSDVGYNIINSKDSAGISIKNEYTGRGGLSRFCLGWGTSIFKYASAGFNYSYIFGQVDETQKRRYPGNRIMTSLSDNRNLYLRGNRLDLGLQFHISRDSGFNHVLGISYTGFTKLKGEQNRLVYTFTELYTGSEIEWDTILLEKEKKTNVSLPNSINVSYTIGKGEKWQASGAYFKNFWSKYKNVFGNNNQFTDENSFSLGFFVCPKSFYDKSVKTEKIKNYFKSIRYSIGYYQSNGFINIKEKNIRETALCIGLGLPFTQVHKHIDGSRTIVTSRIFLSGEFVKKGTTQNNLIEENYFRFTLGLNLADKWFNKRLYN